jgi:hypothetical protein
MRSNSEIPDFVFLLFLNTDFTFPQIADILPTVFEIEILAATKNVIKYTTKSQKTIIRIDNRNNK